MDTPHPRDSFAHGGRAYLNNASVSLQPHQSIRAMAAFAQRYSEAGPDSLASEPLVAEAFRSAREAIAGVIGCERDEIVFTQSVTDGINMVAGGMAFGPRSNIVTRGGAHEHHANHYAWLRLSRTVEVRSAPIDEHGLPEEGSIDRLVDGDTALVSLSHALYNTGAILPIAEIGADLRSRGVPFLVDAAQTVGCMGRMDVHAMSCDFVSFNCSKWLCGPMGTGVLYCRRGSEDLLTPLAVGGESAMVHGGGLVDRAMPERLQAGFRNYAGIAAMDASVRHLSAHGLGRIREDISSLAARLREGLASVRGATVLGPEDPAARTSIVPFELAGRDPAEVVRRLEAQGMVLAVREMVDRRVVRASPHYFNTEAEIDGLLAALAAP